MNDNQVKKEPVAPKMGEKVTEVADKKVADVKNDTATPKGG